MANEISAPSPKAPLWTAWWEVVRQLRPAFSRNATFLWFAAALAAMCARSDRRGVSSCMRTLGLKDRCYSSLLACFHSSAVNLPHLARLWSALVLALGKPFLLLVGGRIVVLADGIKAPKTGRKMPAVKKLHQESGNNTKPEFITGHSCQALAVVAAAAGSFLAIPLAGAIHEGVVTTNRDKRTLPGKLVAMLDALGLALPLMLVADAYYANKTVLTPLLRAGRHLISAMRLNAVAYEHAVQPTSKRRGRPAKYGRKIRLRGLFERPSLFLTAKSPVYGERGVELRYLAIDLLWRPAGRLMRFVLVEHPTRGRKILLCSDLTLDPLEIVRAYGIRFKIEVTFKQAVHTVGVWSYHFWMAAMKPRRPGRSGNQHLHRESKAYRDAVQRKMRAYQFHIQTGFIAQGLLQLLAMLKERSVWSAFGSWLRTIRPDVPPSEMVVATALRESLPEFLASSSNDVALAKFIAERIDLERAEGWRLAS